MLPAEDASRLACSGILSQERTLGGQRLHRLRLLLERLGAQRALPATGRSEQDDKRKQERACAAL
jgi:hypothetical protein